MRNLPLAALALGAVAAAATPTLAADLPFKVPALVAPYDWTGFYGGANIGGAVGRTVDIVAAPPGTPFSSTTAPFNGTAAGIDGGYNWQFGWWVAGVEADIQWSSITANLTTSNPAGISTLSDMETLNWFGTGRGRLGVTPAPGWLLYGTGGVAVGSIRSDEAVLGTTFTSAFTTTRVGWTAGAGVEAAITALPTGVWTARLEFLYLDFGTWSNTFAGLAPATPMTLSVHPTDFVVRVGINYRFAPAPLLARD
jgi:outer membrane immunogenic protein